MQELLDGVLEGELTDELADEAEEVFGDDEVLQDGGGDMLDLDDDE